MIRGTFRKRNIFDHKTDIFCPVFRPPFKNQTIRQSDTFEPFVYQTCPLFRWLLYLIQKWQIVFQKSMQKTLIKIIDNDINPYVDQWEKEGHYPAHEASRWRHLRNVVKIFASLYQRTQNQDRGLWYTRTCLTDKHFLEFTKILHIEHAEIQDQYLSSILLLFF